MLDVLPADLPVSTTVGALSGETDSGEALAGSEHDPAVLVVPRVVFVLLHQRELQAIDGD